MSQNSGSSSGTPRRSERIIPIQIEGEESKAVTSTTHNIRSSLRRLGTKQEEPKAKHDEDIEIINTSKEESDGSPDKVCNSVKSLCLSSEAEQLDVSEDRSSIGTIVDAPPRILPGHNVPEKIVIVLDRAVDDNSTDFEIASGKKYSPLFMLQHAIKIFVHNKSCIDNHHEFALVYLNENTASWVHDFTNSPHDIIRTMQSMTACEPEDIFSLNTVFDLIQKNVQVEKAKADLSIPPLSIVRIVLLYGRSYSMPELTRTREVENLLNSPYFLVDVVMTHEPPSSANHCHKIYRALQEIDGKGFAYSFSVSRNASDLHLAMGKILSHPLQRPHQMTARLTKKVFDCKVVWEKGKKK